VRAARRRDTKANSARVPDRFRALWPAARSCSPVARRHFAASTSGLTLGDIPHARGRSLAVETFETPRDSRADAASCETKHNRNVTSSHDPDALPTRCARVQYRRRESAADASRVTSARKLRSRMPGGKVQAASGLVSQNERQSGNEVCAAAIFHSG